MLGFGDGIGLNYIALGALLMDLGIRSGGRERAHGGRLRPAFGPVPTRGNAVATNDDESRLVTGVAAAAEPHSNAVLIPPDVLELAISRSVVPVVVGSSPICHPRASPRRVGVA
jgi:hypothetical protein